MAYATVYKEVIRQTLEDFDEWKESYVAAKREPIIEQTLLKLNKRKWYHDLFRIQTPTYTRQDAIEWCEENMDDWQAWFSCTYQSNRHRERLVGLLNLCELTTDQTINISEVDAMTIESFLMNRSKISHLLP